MEIRAHLCHEEIRNSKNVPVVTDCISQAFLVNPNICHKIIKLPAILITWLNYFLCDFFVCSQSHILICNLIETVLLFLLPPLLWLALSLKPEINSAFNCVHSAQFSLGNDPFLAHLDTSFASDFILALVVPPPPIFSLL